MTGHAGDFPLEYILAEGSADVMFKPFHVNEFRARIALADRRIAAMRVGRLPEPMTLPSISTSPAPPH